MKDGGSAFPETTWGSPNGMIIVDRQAGMSLRDYFAAQAMMQGMAVLVASKHNLNDHQLDQLARTAYLAADAMLRARR